MQKPNQVQYRKVLSVIIRAKIRPSGSATIIRIALANQVADSVSDMMLRL